MPIFPKPPKLYYYLAGLVVFILGGTGFYFYQKQNNPKPDSNSLTSTTEQAKTLDEANSKPKKENLTSASTSETQITSASFDADPNTDVIVFEECNIVLKIQKNLKNSKVNVYSKSNTGVGWNTEVSRKLGSINSSILIKETDGTSTRNQAVSCSKTTESVPPQNKQSNKEYSSTLINNLKKDHSDLMVNEFNNVFSFKNYNYYVDESLISTPLINSAKFDFENIDKYNQIKVIDLDLIPDSIPTKSNTENISSLSLIGCGKTWWVSDMNFDRCILSDQDFRPILDLNTLLPSNKSTTDTILAQLGKKTADGQYIILVEDIATENISSVYEFNFNTNEIKNIQLRIESDKLGDY